MPSMILYGYRVNEDKHTVNFGYEHGIVKIEKSILDQQKLKLFKIINYSVDTIDLSQAETDELIIACGYNKQLINTAIKYCLVVLFDINYRNKHFSGMDEFNEKVFKYQINDCVSQKFINRFDIEGEKKIVKPGISTSRSESRSESKPVSNPESKPASKPVSKPVSNLQTPREKKSNSA